MYAMRMRDESGGSLVEFAVVAPLLFIVLFGIIEFGILLYDKAIITNASREGARAGIVFDTVGFRDADNEVVPDVVRAAAEQIARDYCWDKEQNKSRLISFGEGAIVTAKADVSEGNDDASTVKSGDVLIVKVTYPFRFLVFSNIISLIGGEKTDLINLKAETVMRLE